MPAGAIPLTDSVARKYVKDVSRFSENLYIS